jgi:hypothetical protein
MQPNAAQDRDHEDYNIIGKLKPGVTVAQAQAEMNTLTPGLRQIIRRNIRPMAASRSNRAAAGSRGDARRTLVICSAPSRSSS